jgi:uncharacterized membrane protein
LLAFWLSIFGFDLSATRLFSLAMSVLTFPAVFIFARKYFDLTTALFALLLLSCSPVLLHYSEHARTYALTILASVICGYFYLGLKPNTSLKNSIPYFLSTIFMLGCHLTTLSIVGLQSLHFLYLHRDGISSGRLKFWLKTQALVGLGYLPVVWTILHRYNLIRDIPVIYSWVRKPDLADFFRSFLVLNGAGETNHYINQAQDLLDPLLLGPLLLALFLFSLIAILVRNLSRFRASRFSEPERLVLSYLLLWLFFPVTILFTYSLLHQSVFLGRGFVTSLIPMIFLAAFSLRHFFQTRAQLGLIAVIFVGSNAISYLNSTWGVEGWGELGPAFQNVSSLKTDNGVRSIVFVRPAAQAIPLAYVNYRKCFYSSEFDSCLKDQGIAPVDSDDQILAQLEPGVSAWLFDIEYDLGRNLKFIESLKGTEKINYLSDSEVFPNVLLSHFTLKDH